MNPITLGLLCGLIYAVLDVLIMIPMPEKDQRKKREAMAGAFLERFMTGFIIPNLDLGISYVLVGLFVGIGLSLPTAIITRAYLPIIGIGVLGGLIIGAVANSVII